LAENLLLVQKEGSICTLTINQPERQNILNSQIFLSLGDILNALKEEDKTRVVVIRGAGEEAFSAGYDIGRLGASESEQTGPRANPMEYGMNCVTSFPYPVIAMIYGYAIGGGLELAATCDLRLAADNARLGMTPARLGLFYRPSGLLTFINLVGISLTKELFYTGRLITAHRAKEKGLVDQIFPSAELEKATYALAQEIAENAPLTIRGVKTTISRLLKYQKLSPEDETELRTLQSQAMFSEDLKEGQQAFLEKRKPRFTGR
jgi:enoyl-CoA hydratase